MTKKFNKIVWVPQIKLKCLEKTAVNTKTQKEYDMLMMICEVGCWTFPGGVLPTENNEWKVHKEETCVYAGINYDRKRKEREFETHSIDYCINEKIKEIPLDEFCAIQRVYPSIFSDIEAYFNKNKPNRKSRGD